MIEIRKPDRMPKMLMSPVSPLPGIHYVPSLYALPFEHEQKHYVFHNLTKQCIEGVLPQKAAAGEGYDELISARFLVPEGQDECAYYNHICTLARVLARKKGHGVYTILPTTGCNARCTYCFEKGMRQDTMTPETVEQVIRYILDTHAGPKVRLEWFGGEPLVSEGIIDRICGGLREAGLQFISYMISNGSLITPRTIQKMKDDWKLEHIQISMDGAEQDYIRRKRYRAYHDYYHQVMENVSRLSEAGIYVNLRCNVDEENWDRVPQFLEDLAEGVKDKKNVDMHFYPMFEVRHSDGDVPLWKKIMDARSLIEQAGFDYRPVILDETDFRIYRCKVDSGSVFIWPDGSLYACSTIVPDGRYGDIWQGITNEAVREHYTQMHPTREKCRTCPYLPNCTPFNDCPITNTNCRQIYDLLMAELLNYLVEDH